MRERMVFNWQKISFSVGEIQERYDLSKKQKKDKKKQVVKLEKG